jgi:ferredoxin
MHVSGSDDSAGHHSGTHIVWQACMALAADTDACVLCGVCWPVHVVVRLAGWVRGMCCALQRMPSPTSCS